MYIIGGASCSHAILHFIDCSYFHYTLHLLFYCLYYIYTLAGVVPRLHESHLDIWYYMGHYNKVIQKCPQ